MADNYMFFDNPDTPDSEEEQEQQNNEDLIAKLNAENQSIQEQEDIKAKELEELGKKQEEEELRLRHQETMRLRAEEEARQRAIIQAEEDEEFARNQKEKVSLHQITKMFRAKKEASVITKTINEPISEKEAFLFDVEKPVLTNQEEISVEEVTTEVEVDAEENIPVVEEETEGFAIEETENSSREEMDSEEKEEVRQITEVAKEEPVRQEIPQKEEKVKKEKIKKEKIKKEKVKVEKPKKEKATRPSFTLPKFSFPKKQQKQQIPNPEPVIAKAIEEQPIPANTNQTTNTLFKNIEKAKCQNSTVLYYDIINMSYANQKKGKEAADKQIQKAKSLLEKVYEKTQIYSLGGDKFIILLGKMSEDSIHIKINQLENILNETDIRAKARDAENYLGLFLAVGYARGSENITASELVEKAKQSLIERKEAYKAKHPLPVEPKTEEKTSLSEQDYDSLLSKENQLLKETVRDNHIPTDEDTTESIMMEISRRRDEIAAILIADKDFNTLMVIAHDLESFLDLVTDELECQIDYSYIYVVYAGGSQYYGCDDYMSEITELFESIGECLKTCRLMSEEDLLKVRNINIFKEIYYA